MYCRRCGAKLRDNVKFCPKCGTSIKKKKKNKIKLIAVAAGMVVFLFIVAGTVFWFKTGQKGNEELNLEDLNQKCVHVTEKDIIMESETAGKAQIIVEFPDYTKLYQEASQQENPEQYVIEALQNKNYDIQKAETTAEVSVEDEKTVIHSQEAVEEVLEEAMLEAISALEEE